MFRAELVKTLCCPLETEWEQQVCPLGDYCQSHFYLNPKYFLDSVIWAALRLTDVMCETQIQTSRVPQKINRDLGKGCQELCCLSQGCLHPSLTIATTGSVCAREQKLSEVT